MRSKPKTSKGSVTRRPRKERGVISPYPTVDIVTMTNHAAAGIDANCVGSPSELTNVSSVVSQVPRSMKYLHDININTALTKEFC